jgi:hypothetical protein
MFDRSDWELDLSQLPDHLGRVVVWDDVRGDRALSREIAGIVLAMQYFGIKAQRNGILATSADRSSRTQVFTLLRRAMIQLSAYRD